MELQLPANRKHTVEEYLAFEDSAEERHEYRDGEIFAMAGARNNHNQISENLTGQLYVRLAGSGCLSRGPDQRVRVDRSLYCYPDKLVVCQPLVFDPPDGDVVLTNPRVIFEVLSKSSELEDRTEKFYRYMRIDSLYEYVLISQDKPRAETFYRQPDGVWAIGGMIDGLSGVVPLRSLEIELKLSDIYSRVSFPAA